VKGGSQKAKLKSVAVDQMPSVCRFPKGKDKGSLLEILSVVFNNLFYPYS